MYLLKWMENILHKSPLLPVIFLVPSHTAHGAPPFFFEQHSASVPLPVRRRQHLPLPQRTHGFQLLHRPPCVPAPWFSPRFPPSVSPPIQTAGESRREEDEKKRDAELNFGDGRDNTGGVRGGLTVSAYINQEIQYVWTPPRSRWRPLAAQEILWFAESVMKFSPTFFLPKKIFPKPLAA